MNNSTVEDDYHFKDFTTEHYRYIIREAKKNYQFSSYDSFDKNSKFILCRHDVDISAHRALKLATIEKEEGISATYFWHMHSEYYNLFEKEIFEIVKQISSLGHHFGLHFDSHFYNVQTQEQIEKHLSIEKDILENIFNVKIRVFSFHNTNPFVMSCKDWKYAGLINTYARYFQEEVTYCSDSNGYWRFNRMSEIVENGEAKCLQLLTHPVWWHEEIMSPWQKVQRSIDLRADKIKNHYCNFLQISKMKNIDWEGEV